MIRRFVIHPKADPEARVGEGVLWPDGEVTARKKGRTLTFENLNRFMVYGLLETEDVHWIDPEE